MSDINFLDFDAKSIENELINAFESATGETLYPGDERRIFLMQLLPVIIGMKNSINDSARQNLLRYAKDSVLDALGESVSTSRLPAQKSTVTIRFTLSEPQNINVIVPDGTRVTPDGEIYFVTSEALTVTTGQTYGDIKAEALEAGTKYNGFTPGQIKNLVDPLPFVATISNIDTSIGGADAESDDSYRERIRLAPESFSVAGPEGAYIFWAKTADSNISDVCVTSPSPGVVKVIPLLNNGEIPGQSILDKVYSVVSDKNRRPLTDNVVVEAPNVINYDINLTYYISKDNQTDESKIKSEVESAVNSFIEWQKSVLKRPINPDYLRQLILNAGAYRLIIDNPDYTTLNDNEVAICQNVNVTYGGLE